MRVWTVVCAIAIALGWAVPARAQWYAGAFLGGNHSLPAEVAIDQPARDTSLRVHDVAFEARPLASPQYYAWRVGRTIGASRRFGLEVEVIHLKLYADTARAYGMSGRVDGVAVPASGVPLEAYVQRYSMSHGLNFILINLMTSRSLVSDRVRIVARAGAGPTVPHAESSVGGVVREQYEFAGPGAGAGGGVMVALGHGVSAAVEYKFTYAKPEISIADGTGRTRAATHQVMVGLAFGMPR
jgi:hypothetical protein